jgi:hypothetical protein
MSAPSPATSGDSFNPLPIWIKCARARLRAKHMLSWGIIVLSITAFVFLMTYLTSTHRGIWNEVDSAKATFIPVIIIQSIIMMLLGTGAVASGLAREREERLLDYHRMTPMSATAKIVGFLFGLPVREYFLFLLTMPFIVFAAIKSEFSLAKLAHFYLVFFTSVWVYHMTGMVAGMASSRPRMAAMLAQGMVVVLYLILPRLELVGLRFFEYFTILPTFFGMVYEELSANNALMFDPTASELAMRYQDVPFFNLTLHSTVYALFVQGFLLTTMFIIVRRKWLDEFSHPLAKLSAMLFYAGVLIFLAGNLWPIVSDRAAYDALMWRLGARDAFSDDELGTPVQILTIMMFVLMVVSGLICLLMINVVTPSRHTADKEVRRAGKLGLARVPMNSDGASSLPVTLVMIVMTLTAAAALVLRADESGWFFEKWPPASASAPALLLFAAGMLFVQGVRERYSPRVFLVFIFLLWMLPAFTCMILFAAEEAWVAGSYIALPFPPAAQFFATTLFFHETVVNRPSPAVELTAIVPHLPKLAWGGAGIYLALAAAVQVELWRWKRGRAFERRSRVAIQSSLRQSGPADTMVLQSEP